jgi:hypothetical protein
MAISLRLWTGVGLSFERLKELNERDLALTTNRKLNPHLPRDYRRTLAHRRATDHHRHVSPASPPPHPLAVGTTISTRMLIASTVTRLP